MLYSEKFSRVQTTVGDSDELKVIKMEDQIAQRVTEWDEQHVHYMRAALALVRCTSDQ